MRGYMSKFYYEHIGHMQCCEITLTLYKHMHDLSKCSVNVPIKELINRACCDGYSRKIAYSELDRLFYGGVIQDQHDGYCKFTYIGEDYYNQLINESKYQKNCIAMLVRGSKLKGKYNITLQETTFFNPLIYKVIEKYSLRSGGARDFIRCVDIPTLNNLIGDLSENICYEPISIDTIEDLIEQVKLNGKYWASVGGKYSWIIFSQRYHVDVDFINYKKLIYVMIRPPEWGGRTRELSHAELLNLLGNEQEIERFLYNIIIRKTPFDTYRLTCPGYLIYERLTKGKVFEFELRKKPCNNFFELLACNAYDCTHEHLFKNVPNAGSTLMSLLQEGELKDMQEIINSSITGKMVFR